MVFATPYEHLGGTMRFETLAIHCQETDPLTGSVTVPVYQTSTYQHEAIGKHKGYEYSRSENPTRKVLETTIASLENGAFGLAFASGVAATAAVFSIFKHGDHIVVGDDIYGGTYRLLEKVFKRWGLKVTYADVDDLKSFQKAIQKQTKLVWVETPTNPLLKIIDLKRLSEMVKRKNKNVLIAVDNTFSSPFFQRPLTLGADIIVHSTTKYLSGHSDIIGGAVVTSSEKLFRELKSYQSAAGAVPGPWDCWLVLRGIKTLAIRMKEHESNALFLAEYLKGHPRVEKIYYPGLASHPQQDVARKQMSGFGGMVSIELKGGFRAVEKFLSKLKLFTLAASLGGVESLVLHPATYSHRILPEKERKKLGISDSLIRLSVGIEHREDLKKDLEQALQ
jgi:cystathionine gamma-synthase/cystathionine gamma-lyase